MVVTQIIVQDDRVTEQEPKRKTMEHPLSNKGVESRLPKVTPIIEDYEISSHVLGLGINGKVVQCYDKQKRQKYALKVAPRFKFVSLRLSPRSLEHGDMRKMRASELPPRSIEICNYYDYPRLLH